MNVTPETYVKVIAIELFVIAICLLAMTVMMILGFDTLMEMMEVAEGIESELGEMAEAQSKS